LARVAHRARDRGDVDDLAKHLFAAVTLGLGRVAHVRGNRARHPKRDHDVDVEHRLELLVAHPVRDAVPRVSGVVDEDVHLAEGIDGFLDDLVAGACLGEVARDGDGLAIDLARSLFGDLTVDVVDRHLCPFVDEQIGRRTADSASRARDDRGLAIK
jgi:hypothetical protein